MRIVTLTAALLLLAATAAVHASTHVLKERAPLGVPQGWTQLSRASPDQRLELSILIRQRNLDVLEETLFAVSDPASPRYGQHLTFDAVHDLTAPSDQHVAQVMNWVHSHGVSTRHASFTPNRDIIRVQATVAQAEAMLQTEYFEFAHKEADLHLVRALRYNVPSFLADIIDTVGPTVRFPSEAAIRRATRLAKAPSAKKVALMKKTKAALSAAAPSECSEGTTPLCLRALYSVNSFKASSGKSSMVATGFLEQYIAPSDLASFFKAFDPSNARSAKIVGPNDATQPGVEASLDIQYTMGVAPGVPGMFWYTPGRQPNNTENEPFLVFLESLSSDSSAPWVVSTSYGDDEPTVNFDYATRMNVEFQKLGVRGISMLYSSGDGGVSGGQSQQCTVFVPTYPAGSPFVTAVGGTTSFGPEVGVEFSSGGFTNYWGRPDYQKQAVTDYIDKYGAATLPPVAYWNYTGRGFPDVSAQGTDFPVYVGGWAQPVDGTSCSAPTFSGIVALLNDVRFAAGKSALGFLNPLLYAHPEVLTDITSGNNPGCGTNGFTATKGWDPVTGLGTPNFEAMSKLVASLP